MYICLCVRVYSFTFFFAFAKKVIMNNVGEKHTRSRVVGVVARWDGIDVVCRRPPLIKFYYEGLLRVILLLSRKKGKNNNNEDFQQFC